MKDINFEEWNRKQRHKWDMYEVEKKKIQRKKLDNKEYDIEISALIKRLGI
jgi:hypothetical protein